MKAKTKHLQIATFAGGCFWCTEAIFKRLKGVESIVPGYAGGNTQDPTYEQVCTGSTGHAEAVQITFDSNIISFETLLEIFFKLHDPTTLNRQGNDVGEMYRSSIFFHDETQKEIAKKVKARIEKEGIYKNKIVTAIIPFKNFYPAEKYHHDYYDNNKSAPYCRVIIDPKIKKLYKDFKEITKPE